MNPSIVEPIHPLAGLPFHGDLIVEETDRMDEFCLVQAIQTLGQSIAIALSG